MRGPYKIRSDECYLCGKRRPGTHMDHDHETGKIRGVLCAPCNRALGVLGDNADGLQRALAYVSASPIGPDYKLYAKREMSLAGRRRNQDPERWLKEKKRVAKWKREDRLRKAASLSLETSTATSDSSAITLFLPLYEKAAR